MGIVPVWRGWFGACLALAAFSVAACIVDEGTRAIATQISVVGLPLVAVATILATLAPSQKLVVALGTVTFGLAGSALVYLATHMERVGPVVFLDGKGQTLFVVGAIAFGALGAGLLGARLRPGPRPPATPDAHHPALLRAGALALAVAAVTASTLMPTRFFLLPLATLAVGAITCVSVIVRERAFQRQLAAIDEGRDPTFAIVPAEKGDPELPRLTRWGAEIGLVEHGYLVRKKPAGSYRDAAEREEPVNSVAVGRIEGPPRALVVATLAGVLLGMGLVGTFALSAPMIGVPAPLRTLYGDDTRCRLRRQAWYDANLVVPKGVVLFDIDRNYGSKVPSTPPFRWIGYDRSRSHVLSPTELFVMLGQTNSDPKFLAEAAVNLLFDVQSRYADGEPKLDGRVLRFDYATTYAGSWRRPWTKVVNHCSVSLDTAIVTPCTIETLEMPPLEMPNRMPADRDPHHAK